MDQKLVQSDGFEEQPAAVQDFFSQVAALFDANPFQPHPVFSGAHAQTLAAYAWPRKYRLTPEPADEERLFEVEPGIRVLAKCRWHSEPEDHPTVVAWHGMEGSTSSVYMIAVADKAFREGFNVVRVNFRNCGGTEHLSRTLYHGGMSHDLNVVIEQLIKSHDLSRLYLLGFSLGGNMVLKLAGEYGSNSPSEVRALCVVSPSVDLRASTEAMTARRNWVYNRSFIQSLKKKVRIKHSFYPELYDITKLSRITTIRDFDEEFTSPLNGFIDANDYYQQASCVSVAHQIRLPTLIIHSKDDPFIPFDPLRNSAFSENPYVMTVGTDAGGHVAFISRDKGTDSDRFWAENRVPEFFKLAEQYLWRVQEFER
jgi:predicted alpha/beta-fold hydrolase